MQTRQFAWLASAVMLIALTALNVGMVILVYARFSTWFMLSNGINLALALGLRRGKHWARISTLVWEALALLLALAVAVQSGATSDLLVTALLQGGILLPLAGPPHRLKTSAGILLFLAGLGFTLIALLSQRVTVR